jgi:PTH1 family peptidyl-tRNA hydrolase
VKLVVGLGNPQARYAATRHNIGARIAARFAADCGISLTADRFNGRFGRGRLVRSGGEPSTRVHDIDPDPIGDPIPDELDVAILTPETYMNRSGEAVAAALRELPVENVDEDLLIVVDDLDLPFGRLRIRPRGGSAGHRGLENVIEQLGHGDFPRLRFGIGRPDAGLVAVDWVLQAFSDPEEAVLEHRIPLAAEAVSAALSDGVVAAMNRYNRDSEADA